MDRKCKEKWWLGYWNLVGGWRLKTLYILFHPLNGKAYQIKYFKMNEEQKSALELKKIIKYGLS